MCSAVMSHMTSWCHRRRNVLRTSDALRTQCIRSTLTQNCLEKGHETQARDHPDHRVVCRMPHPPPHIWARPCDRSLQPLYLHYLAMRQLQIDTFTEMRAGWPSHSTSSEGLHLRVPRMYLHSSLLWQPWLLQGRMHRRATTHCCIRSPIAGRRKQGVLHHPLWPPTPTIIIVVRPPVLFHPA